jgi:hypothetical protein
MKPDARPRLNRRQFLQRAATAAAAGITNNPTRMRETTRFEPQYLP